MARFIGTVFLQALMSGAVVMALANRDYFAAFITSYLLNELWWYNVGRRIDYHGHPRMGRYYALTVAVGSTIGAWFIGLAQ